MVQDFVHPPYVLYGFVWKGHKKWCVLSVSQKNEPAKGYPQKQPRGPKARGLGMFKLSIWKTGSDVCESVDPALDI